MGDWVTVFRFLIGPKERPRNNLRIWPVKIAFCGVGFVTRPASRLKSASRLPGFLGPISPHQNSRSLFLSRFYANSGGLFDGYLMEIAFFIAST